MNGVQDLSGTILKGYHLGDLLGASSHSAVYEARRGGRRWAVKILDAELEPDASLSDRLRGEAAVLASAALPQVVPIQETGRSGRLTYVASPLVRARALSGLMGRDPLDNERAWTLLSRLADALDAAHQRSLVYRGLRPGHVLVREDELRLAEFGVASARAPRLALSSAGYRLAEPQYLAPEQVEGQDPDRRSDVYALAVLIFELLTCTPLHGNASSAEILRMTLTERPPSAHERRPDLLRGIDRVLRRALSRRPDERHASAGELLEDVVALPEDGTVHAVPALPRPKASGPPAVVKADSPPDSMVAMLVRMGLPALRARDDTMLNAYFATMVRFAEEACGERWPDVLAAAGLSRYLVEAPPDDAERTARVDAASRLADGIESAFGLGAPEVLRQWGRLTTDFWIHRSQRLQEGEVTYMKPLRLHSSAAQKVEDALYVFGRILDRVRGERLTVWQKLDRRQFWVVQYDNLTAVGRRRPARACDFWTASLEQALRWGECANQWYVEEAECGCVTGTFDCVFTVRRVQT